MDEEKGLVTVSRIGILVFSSISLGMVSYVVWPIPDVGVVRGLAVLCMLMAAMHAAIYGFLLYAYNGGEKEDV